MSRTYIHKSSAEDEPLSDEVLVSECQDGNMHAFDALIHRYQAPLFNYIRRMVADSSDAEDLFQETFLRVFKSLDRFREGSPVRPWVYRIATNACRDLLRRRRFRRMLSLSAPARNGMAPIEETIPAAGPNPRDRAREAEFTARLAKAVDALPWKQRAVFLMSKYDNMSYGEIAEALGVPEGTAKSRMNTAVNTLLDSLREVLE